jgi:hypothetical protein
MQARNPTAGASAAGFQQQQPQQQGDYGGLSLPASPTMLQYQQAAAAAGGGGAAGCSGLSSPSSGSWPDPDFSSGALLPGLQGAALDVQAEQAPQAAAGRRNDGRGGSGSDSGGEGDAGMLVPTTAPLLKQEPGVPLGLQLHMPSAAQQAPQHGVQPDLSVSGSQQQQQQQCGAQGSEQPAAPGRGAACSEAGAGQQQLVELRKQQQQHRDAQLMPPPAPPQHMTGRGQSPAAAAAAAADAAARCSARPPPLVIPSTKSTSAPSTGTGGSSQPPAGAGQQLPYTQAHTHVVLQQQQQQQQGGGHQGFDRPGSGPSPSPAYPPCSTTITPSMLSMGLAESHPALTAGVTAGGPSMAAAAAAGAGGWVPSGDGSNGSSSGVQVPRLQRRPQSLPSSPAIAPASAMGGTAAGEYSSSAGILASAAAAAAAAAAAGGGGSGAGASGLSAAATAVLGSVGRVYIKVQCGSQFGWLDVRDSLVIVDVGTKVREGSSASASQTSQTPLCVRQPRPADCSCAHKPPLLTLPVCLHFIHNTH